MFNKSRKFLAFIILILSSYLVSCTSVEPSSSSSFFSYSFSSKPDYFFEEIEPEEWSFENKFYEDVLTENISFEQIVVQKINAEIYNLESIYNEEVTIDGISVNYFSDIDELIAYNESYSIIEYDLNFEELKEQFDNYLKLVLIEVAVSVAGIALSIVTGNLADTIVEAVNLSVILLASTIGAYIAAEKNAALSKSVGNSVDVIEHQRLQGLIEGQKNALNWSLLITVPFALYNFSLLTKNLIASSYRFVKSNRLIDIFQDTNKIGVLKGKKIYSPDDVSLKNPIGKLDDFGNITLNDGRTLGNLNLNNIDNINRINIEDLNNLDPSGTYYDSKQRVKTIVNKDSEGMYTRTEFEYNKNGNIKSEKKYRMTQSGWELDNSGKPLRRWNSQANRIDADFTKAQTNGLDVDFIGEISNRRVVNATNGRIEFLDINNIPIAYVENGYVKLISNESNKRIALGKVEIIGDSFYINPTWANEIKVKRHSGTQKYRSGVVNNIINYDVPDVQLTAEKKGIPFLTKDELAYTRKFKELPPGFAVHHKKGVKNYPELADDLSNMELVRTNLPANWSEAQKAKVLRDNRLKSGNIHKELGHKGLWSNEANPTGFDTIPWPFLRNG
jgi:hypothetical protein